MIAEAKAFWDAISGKVKSLIRSETENALRLQRYDVTTAPDGSVIGVTQPYGANEIFLPYSQEVAGATTGDTVLVAWWGSMSNAKAYYFANGYEGVKGDATTNVFSSVGDIGLTVGSTTITGAYAALPENSVLYAAATEFASGQVPQAYGVVEFVRLGTAVRGYVIYRGKEFGQIDQRMFLDQAGVPDGTWHPIPNGWEQLWTNDTPTETFAAQTVTLDLSWASEIRIEYRLSTTSETRYFTDGFVNGQILPVTGMSNLSSTTAYLLIRNATPSATGVTFQTAYRRSTVATTAASSSPGYMIPVAIYAKGA